MRDVAKAFEADVATLLRERYGLDTRVELVVPGVNITYSATTSTNQKIFVRLYRECGRSVCDVEVELAALKAIEPSKAMSAARPLADLSGAHLNVMIFQAVPRFTVAFEAAHGRVASKSASDLHRMGRALADLHQQIKLTTVASHRELFSFRDVSCTIEKMQMHSQAGRIAADKIVVSLDALRSSGCDMISVVNGFCHGDFRDKNLLISNDHITFFDFDDCGVGPQWLDLATMGWWLEASKDQTLAAPLWQALLGGYGRPVQKEEFRDSIRWLLAIVQLRSLRFLIDYTTMPQELWATTFANATALAERASSGRLHIEGH